MKTFTDDNNAITERENYKDDEGNIFSIQQFATSFLSRVDVTIDETKKHKTSLFARHCKALARHVKALESLKVNESYIVDELDMEIALVETDFAVSRVIK